MSIADERGAWPEGLVEAMARYRYGPVPSAVTDEDRVEVRGLLATFGPAIFASELRRRVAAIPSPTRIRECGADRPPGEYAYIGLNAVRRHALLRALGVEVPDAD